MIIVIDGPAGSGKSSTARAVARKMDIRYLDSGALYRAATWLYIEAGQDLDSFFKLLDQASISLSQSDNDDLNVSVNGTDVTSELRSAKVSDNVSQIAALPQVRSYVNNLMHRLVERDTYIAEGRDLGTAVFPDAEIKFFMSADVDERARRRHRELTAAGSDVAYEKVRNNILERDKKDSQREADPLKKASDAIEIDTSSLYFEEQVHQICNLISDQTELAYKS